MKLYNEIELPVILRTGVFYTTQKEKKSYSFSKLYNTRYYPKRRYNKPIIF